MIVVNCEQGSPEWLSARVGIATASRFADVLARLKGGEEAATRKGYRTELVVERLTGSPAPSFTSFDMKLGTEREPLGRAEYEARFGAFVTEVGFCRHDSLPAGSSPDGLIEEDGGIEIKCPNRSTHFGYLKLDTFQAPSNYVAQIQGNLWITGRQWWDFVSYNPDFPPNLQLIRRRIARDNAFIAMLENEVALFLEEVDLDEQFARNYKEST